MRRPLNQSGDTIVELMMAVLVLGTVLTGAFLLSQRSSNAVQNSQEQAESNQLLSTQVELVRTMVIGNNSQLTAVYSGTPTPMFCIYQSGGVSTVKSFPAFTLPNQSVSQVTYPSECKFGRDNRYNIAIRYDTALKLFVFDSRWDNVAGAISKTSYKYRIQN